MVDVGHLAYSKSKQVGLTVSDVSGVSVDEFSQLGDTCDADSINRAIIHCQQTGKVLKLPYRVYTIKKPIVAQTSNRQSPLKIVGVSGKSSRFNLNNCVTIKRHSSFVGGDMFQAYGQGLHLEDICFDGSSIQGNGVNINRGFELYMLRVRAFNCRGTGLLLRSLSNPNIIHCNVDNCGADDGTEAGHFPAFKLTGSDASERISNSVNIEFLNVERSNGTAVEVAYGSGVNDIAEFVKFWFLHVEQPADNITGGISTRPAVVVGNARNVDFVSPFIYGGKGSLLVVDKQRAVSNDRTSVQVTGGTIMGMLITGGSDISPTNTPDTLIHLKKGDFFSIVGTLVSFALVEHIKIEAEFGSEVHYNSIIINDRVGVERTITDARTNRAGMKNSSTTWAENTFGRIDGTAGIRFQLDGNTKVFANNGRIDLGDSKGVTLPLVDDFTSPVGNRSMFVQSTNKKLAYKDDSGVVNYVSNLGLGTTGSTAAAGNHTHTTANITGLDTALASKLTANKVASQAQSTATDVATLMADHNALLAKLKAAGVML
nr:hypothetical protein [Paenibacillus sp. Marseille-Q4541]